MYCPHCGAELPGDSAFCPHCGSSLAPAPAAPAISQPVNDFRTLNIVLTALSVLSCIGTIGGVFGGLGILFGSQARAAQAAGDETDAQTKAKYARLMFFIGTPMFVFAIVSFTILLILIFAFWTTPAWTKVFH